MSRIHLQRSLAATCCTGTLTENTDRENVETASQREREPLALSYNRLRRELQNRLRLGKIQNDYAVSKTISESYQYGAWRTGPSQMLQVCLHVEPDFGLLSDHQGCAQQETLTRNTTQCPMECVTL